MSVVIAAYDEGEWIGRCLESLLAQTLRGAELIVVDDGSRDATAEIASALGVTVIRAPHRGCGHARALGASHARGDVIVFLDADEVYAEDFLEHLVAPLADPDVAATFPGSVSYLNANEGLARAWLRVRGNPTATPPDYGRENHIGKAVRRADLARVGGYPRAGYGEDALLGELIGPATVVPEARWNYSLPTSAREIFAKSRWIGRGPLFARDHPPFWRLLPPASCLRALRHARAGHPDAAAATVLYDAGRVLGYVEGRLIPSLRARA